MDSKRRHELSQNFLANWLISQYEDWIRPNSGLISWAILIVLLVIAILLFSARVVAWNKASAWRQYTSAVASTDAASSLEALAEAGGPVAIPSRLSLGQILLADACNGMFQNKAESLEKTEKAIVHFRWVRDHAKEDGVRQQALWGLGQSLETAAALRTDKSDLEEAIKAYKTLIERWPNDYLGQRAAKQLAFLERPGTKKFLELAANRVEEKPQAEDFKVEIDKQDPFSAGPGGMDALKSLESMNLGDVKESVEVKVETTEEKPETEKKPESIEEKKEEPKPVEEAPKADEAKTEESKE